MKILLISDSHNSPKLADFLNSNKEKEIICLGDFIINKELLDKYNVTYVMGNCDRYSKPLENVIDINGLKAFITHGHKYNVKNSLDRIYYKTLEENCRLGIFGHTHQQFFADVNGIALINPGAFINDEYAVIDEDNVIYFYRNGVAIKSFKIV